MEVKVLTTTVLEVDADTLLLYVFEDEFLAQLDTNANLGSVDQALEGAVRDLQTQGDFTGKTGQIAVLYPRGALKVKRVLLVALGKRPEFKPDILRRASASGVKRARELKAQRVASELLVSSILNPNVCAQLLTEGALLGLYRYNGQKTGEAPENSLTRFDLLAVDTDMASTAEVGMNIGLAYATGGITARDMANLPPNICTPIYMASMARIMADRVGLQINVFERQQMEELHMGALLAVAQGSDNPPRLIILEHNANRADELDTIVLVGKGVTFDTGGYSIKTADGMVGMKGDMSGAAAVIGAMQTIAMLDLPLHVVGLAPTAENMISGNAYRPQDVITASNGKTIEIISTDAEGRLLLADALVYAKRYQPKMVVDIATLTGACVTALGNAAAGFFCTDDALRDLLVAAADNACERIWQLPLYPEYKKAIESDTADMKNTGGRLGGVGASAVFIQQFVDFPWAHIDMAGMMADLPDNPYIPAKGASGYGARLLAAFASEFVQRHLA